MSEHERRSSKVARSKGTAMKRAGALSACTSLAIGFGVTLSGCVGMDPAKPAPRPRRVGTVERDHQVSRSGTPLDTAAAMGSVVPVQPRERKTVRQDTGIEVVWAIPKEPNHGYVIRYGYGKGDLPFEVRLDSSEVKPYDHPKFGRVYRYVLDSVAQDQPVFVSIAAIGAQGEAASSETFEVQP